MPPELDPPSKEKEPIDGLQLFLSFDLKRRERKLLAGFAKRARMDQCCDGFLWVTLFVELLNCCRDEKRREEKRREEKKSQVYMRKEKWGREREKLAAASTVASILFSFFSCLSFYALLKQKEWYLYHL